VHSYEQNEKHNTSSMTIDVGSRPNASYAISGVVSKGGIRGESWNALRTNDGEWMEKLVDPRFG
jgi:hypothetical protein